MSKEEKKKKGLFDIFWMSIKITIFIILLPIILLVLFFVGGIFFPLALLFIPIIFLACLFVLLE